MTVNNLLNEISGIRTDNVTTEDFVRLRIRQDFHEPVRIAVAPRPAIRHERKLTGFVRAACFFQFLFRFADGGDFRPGINDTWNGIVVDVARLPREDFRDNNTFVFRFVGQHGPRDAIADGVDTGHVGLEMGIDLDNAARVRFDPDGVEPKPFGIRDAADRQQDHVSLNRLRIAAGRGFDRQLHAGSSFFWRRSPWPTDGTRCPVS